MDQELVDLEKDPNNKDLLGDIFRTIHTIKGGAGFLNLVKLEQVSHHAEDVLARLRERSLILDTDMTTTLLHAVDFIKSTLFHLEQHGKEGEDDVKEIVESLQQIAEGSKDLELDQKLPTKAVTAASSDENPENAEYLSEEKESGSVSQQKAQDTSRVKKPKQESAKEGTTSKMREEPESTVSMVEDSRIHVDVNLLDQLMNLTGELVLARNRIVQLASKSDEKDLRAVSQRMNVVISELQETVMKTRMQPVKKIFGALPRLVRDLSKLYGKDVHLSMVGQATELDRSLIEGIKDPLTHLVRNAIDHGIETLHVRRKLGKPSTATISIRAYHEGGLVNIEVADDGAGIDVQRVKAKAIREELLTSHQAEEMSERNFLNLIFRPGFSTAKKITNISGRGVGMDVVKKNLDRIGGTVDVQTQPNKGTTIKIRIPITLAIIPVLIIRSGGQRFAIPQVNLEELIMLQSADGTQGIESVSGAEVYRLRGELLPLLRLHELLQFPPSVETAREDELNIVVLSSGEAQFGLVVDDVGDTEEIVVKPLSSHIKQLSYYDGATIMGDGEVALILNVSGLFHSAQLNAEDIKRAEQKFAEDEGEEENLPLSVSEHKQSIVLFRVGEREYYGVPLAFVVRLEEFPESQIEYSGGREVLQYRGDILPLMRLEQYLDISKTPDLEILSLIVFSVEKQIGLVVTEIINTIEISTHIDTETFKQKGILGSTVVEGHSVLIIDIHELIEMAYPLWYKEFFVSRLSEQDRENLQILLVEDSMFFQNIARSYLEVAGYQVFTANHGNEALEKLEKQQFDLIVTDIDMPYCNGYELTKIIKAKEEWKHIPVMALTALSGEKDRQKGLDAGIDEYQVKLDRDEVLKAIEHLILQTRE